MQAVFNFLKPTFADSKFAAVEVSTGPAWVGLIIGALLALAGVAIAYRLYIQRRGTSARLQARFAGVHSFLFHKWYFDEAIDFLVVRPALWFGHFCGGVLERVVVGDFITGGTTGVVRAGSALVRRAQTGLVRYYAATMVICISGVALYFLISST